MEILFQTFSNASETHVSEGKNYPEQRWMVMPVEIALADFMKSWKSVKIMKIHQNPSNSIDIHRSLLVRWWCLVYRDVAKNQQKHEIFMAQCFFMSETTRKQLTTPTMAVQTTATVPDGQMLISPKRHLFSKKWRIWGHQFGDPAHMYKSPKTFLAQKIIYINIYIYIYI